MHRVLVLASIGFGYSDGLVGAEMTPTADGIWEG